jgi:hypothetical protein
MNEFSLPFRRVSIGLVSLVYHLDLINFFEHRGHDGQAFRIPGFRNWAVARVYGITD